MIKVYLDDERETPEGWVRTYSSAETIAHLRTGNVLSLSLDHDLGTEDDGYQVLLWLEREVFMYGMHPPPFMKCHSANPYAANKMRQAIRKIREEHIRQNPTRYMV